jgi:hypothetical protein
LQIQSGATEKRNRENSLQRLSDKIQIIENQQITILQFPIQGLAN